MARNTRLTVGRSQSSEASDGAPSVADHRTPIPRRLLERDGIVRRVVYTQVPPKVEYALTDCGQALCPVLDALLQWSLTRAAHGGPPPLDDPSPGLRWFDATA